MPAAAPQAPGGTSVAFPPGAATLQADASQTIKAFAGSRGGASVAVTGYGDADSSAPAAQAAAMSLALSRAQAVANALTANGVPASAIRINAEAAGRGAAMRLLQ
jgi:outer membrane protein OmpA-like peptidoglycan-associated protein